jgi:hypothetical protein
LRLATAPETPHYDGSDCMMQLSAASERFAAGEANPTQFLNVKRKQRCLTGRHDPLTKV